MFNPKVRNRIDMFEQLVFFSPFYFPPSLRRLYSVRRLFTLDEYIVSEQARPVVKERCQPFPPVHALFFCGECGSAFPPARRFSPCFATSRSSSAFGERRRWFHRGSNFLQQGWQSLTRIGVASTTKRCQRERRKQLHVYMQGFLSDIIRKTYAWYGGRVDLPAQSQSSFSVSYTHLTLPTNREV